MTDIETKSYVQKLLDEGLTPNENNFHNSFLRDMQKTLTMHERYLLEMEQSLEKMIVIQQGTIDLCKVRVQFYKDEIKREQSEYENYIKNKSRENYQDRVEQGKKNWRRFPDGMPLDILNALDKKKESKS
tara:strand:+ start:101 stop:490 length:390 start_codon:yes stop_codon:yes gene_type:complete